MKKSTVYKKIICLALAICMLFSLTACKKAEAQGQNLYVAAKGIDTKTLKLKVQGTFPEGILPTISYIDQETELGQVPIISVSEKKIEANSASYIITGLQAGIDNLQINFTKDDISYSRIMASITVVDDLKIADCVISISETQDRYILAGGIETDSVDGHMLWFSREGNLKIKSFDDELLDVSGPYYDSEEDATSLSVTGQSSGQSDIVLVDSDDGKKITIGVETYDIDTEAEDENEVFVKVIDSDEEDYEVNDVIDINDINTRENRIEKLSLPENYPITSVTEFDDAESNPVIELEMQNGDDFFFIMAWGNRTFADVRNEVTEKSMREKIKTISIGDMFAEYYNVSGVDMFLFAKDEVVYLASFPKESDMEAHSKVLENIKWVQ